MEDKYLTVRDMAVIRGSALTNYHELVAELGGDGSRLLAGARVSPTDAGSYERFISLPNGARALEATAAALNAPDFGRQLARRQGIEILGPVGLAARTAATVADAFAILEKFMGAYCPVISARVTDHRDPALCRFEFEYLLNPARHRRRLLSCLWGSRCGCCITFGCRLPPGVSSSTAPSPHAGIGVSALFWVSAVLL